MEYVFLGKTLPIDRVAGRLLFTDGRLELSSVEGTLFNGTVRGAADISLAKKTIRIITPTSRSKASTFRSWPISISNMKPRAAV